MKMKLCTWCNRALSIYMRHALEISKCPHCDKPCEVHGQCGYCINASQHMRELDKEINGK